LVYANWKINKCDCIINRVILMGWSGEMGRAEIGFFVREVSGSDLICCWGAGEGSAGWELPVEEDDGCT
jgi:hypothetical protein